MSGFSFRVLVVVLGLGVSCPSVTYATQTMQSESLALVVLDSADDPAAFKAEFEALLRSPAYSDSYTSEHWVKKRSEETPDRPLEPLDESWAAFFRRVVDILHNIASVIGVVGKVLLVLLLLAFMAWLYRHRGAFGQILPKFNKKSLTTYQVSPEADTLADLPDDDAISAAVAELFGRGAYVAGLSLLYRGSLRRLSLTHQLPIKKSQTEAQCQALLKKAAQLEKNEQAFFDELVFLWQATAYGKQSPKVYTKRMLALLPLWQTFGKQGRGDD
ncbi:MAG: hypothetical protein Q4B88_00785 [Moraxella sp.]|nr:hypothetical protein [Moraxella sp.]